MKIDGKAIADHILSLLSTEVAQLKEKGTSPTLAVVLIGDNPDSLSYIKSKQKAADRIGAAINLIQLPSVTTTEQLQELIHKLNNDPSIHGIIIQRPLPENSPVDRTILNTVNPNKDVDGFVPNSPFQVPVAKAILTLLREIYLLEQGKNSSISSFDAWLATQSIAVIGRGETAGKPIADLLIKQGCAISVVHSQTPHPEEVLKKSSIVISCVGKPNTLTKDMIKPSVILIGVGIWWDDAGKMHPDYNEDEIKEIASYYTPTPGGVGPVNVASLMTNLVAATKG